MKTHFEQPEVEALKHYVYCLADPRDKCIFYIGKGQGNRVFDHAKDALKLEDSSLKLDKIREIISSGLSVEHYIIRHGLDSAHEAFLIESVIIDMLTYPAFNKEFLLTNISAGHHQWDEGIKTINEIKHLYMCEKLILQPGHKLLLVCINKSYEQHKAEGEYVRPNIYEATRKHWTVSKQRADEVDYILGVYKGVVRVVIKPTTEWQLSTPGEDGCPLFSKRKRYKIEGITDDVEGNRLYLNKDARDFPFPSGGSFRYISE